MKCPNCFSEMILTFKCNLELEECFQCKGIWIDQSKIKQLWNLKNHEGTINESKGPKYGYLDNLNNKEESIDLDYYYYKKEFSENGSIDDLFGFEFV